MRNALTILALIAATGLLTANTSLANSQAQKKSSCTTYNCGKKVANQTQPQYLHRHITLDGTEPICGFNDGTYLHNRLGCGILN